MPRFIGYYVGISFQAELLAMTLVGLLNSTLVWHPFDWTHQVEKIWELTLSQHYFISYIDFEYWIKTILTWIVITRKIVAYIYTFSYMINFYPILTWSCPNLLLPWLILSFFQNFILKSIVIMIFLFLWSGEKFALIRTIEFILVEFLSLIISAYIWSAKACYYIQLKRIKKIRRIRKALFEKYSINYDLFASDSSSMEMSKESSYGSSLGENRHMSLPNLNEAFYRSIFSDNYNDNKSSRSLTTLSTMNSFGDSEEFISQIVHNTDLMPAEKCMKLLGITDVDVINARARVRKRMLASCPHTEEEKRNYMKTFASKKVGSPRKDDIKKMHMIRGPPIVDYLMTTTGIPGPVFQTDDTSTKLTKKEVDRKENYAIRDQEREMEYFIPDMEIENKKNEKSFIQTKNKQIVESEMEKEFELPQKPVVDFVSDRTDKKEETKLQFVKKKKKKVCPLMKELIKSRPCFSLVGRRKFKGCPFMKETIPSCPPFPCFSATRNEHLNNTNFTKTDAKASQAESNEDISSKDELKDDSTIVDSDVNDKTSLINNSVQSESNTNETTMRELTNKRSENYLTLKESFNIETFNLSNVSKELRLEPRRNFNHIFNNRLNFLPVSNVWSTIGCLPFRQKFNFTSLYDRELQFNKSLFKPSSSQELLDRGRLIAWNPSNTELLVKVPEQVVCYTGLEYKPVSIPGTSNGTQFAKDKLQRLDSIDQESIEIPRYTSIKYCETKSKLDDDHPFYVSQGIVTETRNLTKDFDTRKDRKTISTQTTESVENYNYEIIGVADNTNNYNIYGTDNIYPKFVSKMCETSSFDYVSNIKDDLKNNSYSNVSREGSIENESCCCKDSYNQLISERSNTSSLIQVVHKAENEKSSYSNKPPAYPKKSKKRSLHRLTGVKNKIVKVSFEGNKYLEHYDRLRHDVESTKRGKRVTSSMEREQLEMKALRAYNEITLFEDKREMMEKTRCKTEEIYSFVNDTKDFKIQKVQNKRQVQQKNDDENSINEIEIANTVDSSFACISSFNDEKLLKDKDNIDSSKHEPSCSGLPNIQNKDAAIMLNLLDHHGSQWFKQELRRILTMKTNQVNVKHSEPSHYALKLDKFLTNCQKIDDIHDEKKSYGTENINIPFQVPLSYNYLQTRSNLDANRNVTNEKQDTMVLNLMESIVSEILINSVDFTDFAESTENNEVKEERESLTTNLPKEDESKDTEISNNDVTKIEMNNLSHLSTNPVPPSPCTRMHEDAVESTDVSNNYEEVRRRNMSIHMMNIARNIGWSLRPNGIVLTNKNLQGQTLESTNNHDGQQRDIIDNLTASLVHAATSHKPEIIIRTFPHDSRSTTDQGNGEECTASFFDDIYNTYRLMSTIDERVLHANNEMNVSMEDTLMLPEIQEEDETNSLNDTTPSSYDSIETERNFDLCIVVMENDDLSLESISSMDSVPGDEVIEHDSVNVITSSGERSKMDVTDPRIDFSEEEATKDLQQPTLEMIIAFFSFLLTCYVHYLRSYLFSLSDSSSSFYAYRPCEVHSNNAFKKSFPEKSSHEQCDVLALSDSTNNVNVSELVVEFENEQGNGVIEFTDEIDDDDEVSIESTNQQVSRLHDSFDTMYSRSTVESENAISVGEGSSMEEFP